jgi:hypothetical protein
MTPELLEVLRNIYNAGAGAAHPSAVSAALFGLMWDNAWKDGLAAGQAVQDAGGTRMESQRAFHDKFNEALGWTEAESLAFWKNPAINKTAEDAQAFDEAWDAFDAYVEFARRGR